MQRKRVRRKKQTAAMALRFVLACLVLCLCLAQAAPVYAACYDEAATGAADDAPMLTDDNVALPHFSSPLPLVVLRAEGEDIPAEEDGYFLPYALECREGQAQNTLADLPVASQTASMRNMTDAAAHLGREKDDYFLRFEAPQALAGLDESTEYLLLGGKADKSLIRNYLGYTLGGHIVPGAPGARLCEVFVQTAAGHLYQGVYTLVNMAPRQNSMLFQHCDDGDGIAIETFSTQNDAESGKVYIPFIQSLAWDDRFNEAIGGMSMAESVLYSTQSAIFYTTPKYFDVPTFVRHLILGEVMGNYSGTGNCYYSYNTSRKMVEPTPLWNFEYAIDNQPTKPAVATQLGYGKAPYYAQLFKSPQFAHQVQQQYLALRQGPLDERFLRRMVDAAAALVAPVAARDWARWNSYAANVLLPLTEFELEDESLQPLAVPFARQTATHQEEILRIKTMLRGHNLYIARAFTRFDFSEREVSQEIVLNINPLWVMLFLFVFFALVRFARRYGV